MNTTQSKQKALLRLHQKYLAQPSALLRFPESMSVVFGEGNPNANLLIVGEAPGKSEDEKGRPFVGRSGALLDQVLEIAHIKRPDLYITNIVKSRPPNNRKPTPQEIEFSKPLLMEQIRIIEPKLICTLGSSALQALLGRTIQITKERGKIMLFNGLKLLPTYHPAYILRNPKELNTLAQDIIKASNIINGDLA